MISDILKNSLEKALGELSLSGEVSLEHPANLEHGDYSSNIALQISGKLEAGKLEGTSPYELASKIAEEINNNLGVELLSKVKKVEAVEPGFINFYLTPEFFQKTLKDILEKGEDFGKNEKLKGQKIIIEYTDPNPFKEFHIGHLMPNVIGESLSRIIEFSGAEIKRANYQGDVGLHIAKALFGLKNGKSLKEAYAYGAGQYENHKEEINEINKKVYEKSDEELNALYKKGREESLNAFEEIYKKLDTKFDYYFFESEMADSGKEIVRNNPNLFQKSQGAIVFKGENYGLHTRVFINSEGIPTYEAKELALSKVKYDKFPYDKSIVVTANEINEYFKVLLKVMELVYEKEQLAEKTEHIGHGMLRLPSGKMSSRTGEVISAERLIGDVKEKALEVMEDPARKDGASRELDNKEGTAEIIAVGALKYSILKQSIGKDIVFDMEKAVSFEGDSGPYLQYTYVRAMSLLEKGGEVKAESDKLYGPEKILYRFPEIVERALAEKAPQYITTYLTEIASAFNAFYANEKVVGSAEEGYKLALTKATTEVLRNGLYLLGIKVPDKM